MNYKVKTITIEEYIFKFLMNKIEDVIEYDYRLQSKIPVSRPTRFYIKTNEYSFDIAIKDKKIKSNVYEVNDNRNIPYFFIDKDIESLYSKHYVYELDVNQTIKDILKNN